MKWFQGRKPLPQRADPLRIAELEYELFGIEPQPGTVADFAIRLRRAFAPAGSLLVDGGVITFPSGTSVGQVAEFAVAYEEAGGRVSR
ncbi:hypothetical protein OIU81_02890 [Streptomyces sp. NBC_01454]|uniref:hypothetical protein n=1 Tax=Streptomyces sp. NBC_01454 TaxID=2975867 RepID=UPI002E32C517|nr:hypothetical protein [Streptomyces sp. NBC_01454]